MGDPFSTYAIEVCMSRKTMIEKFQDDLYDISVTGRNVLVTDAMQQYAIEKISKIDRFSNRIVDVNVVMDIQKLEHRIDLILKVDQIIIRCSASSDNMYASIDKVVDRLKAQLSRYKRRIRDHQVKGAPSIEINETVFTSTPEEEINQFNDDISSENNAQLINTYVTHQIVSRESRPLKTLNYGEAIMKMELSGDSFMVFRSEEDQKLKVIYRRDDGNFGVIEPEK